MIQYKGYYIYFPLYLTQLSRMGTWEQVMIVAKSVLTLKILCRRANSCVIRSYTINKV